MHLLVLTYSPWTNVRFYARFPIRWLVQGSLSRVVVHRGGSKTGGFQKRDDLQKSGFQETGGFHKEWIPQSAGSAESAGLHNPISPFYELVLVRKLSLPISDQRNGKGRKAAKKENSKTRKRDVFVGSGIPKEMFCPRRQQSLPNAISTRGSFAVLPTFSHCPSFSGIFLSFSFFLGKTKKSKSRQMER
jgi:hypothetical protein